MPTRTWTGATNNNWNTSTNWAEGFVPTNLDDVIFSTNVNCSVTSSAVCKTLTFGTYSGTFTNTGGLTVSGNVSLGTSVIWGTFTSHIIINATATLTSNGKDIPYLRFNNTITITFADDWSVTSNLYFQNVLQTVTLNGSTINVTNGTISHLNGSTISGTTLIKITGTVNWNAPGSTSYISNPITIDSGVNSFTLSNNFYLANNTITWLSGTMIVTGSSTVIGGNVTFTGTGLTFNNLQVQTVTTLTLSNNITISGTLNTNTSATTFTLNGFTIYIAGSINTIVNTTVSGTTNIVLNGSGTIETTSSSGSFRNNIEINTTGTYTFGTTFRYNTGTFLHTAGTVVTTNNTFVIAGTTTLNTNGITFNTISISGTSTITLSSNLTCNTLTTANTLTFNGNTIYTQSLNVNAIITGTTTLEFYGTGTWTGTTNYIALNINVNCTYLTMTGAIGYRTGTLTWVSGTTDTTGSTVTISTSATTLNVNGSTDGTGSCISNTGINFFNLTCSIATTLTTPICVIGTFNTNNNSYTGSSIYVQGNLFVSNNTGSGSVIMNGTGTIFTNSAMRMSLTINTNGKISISTSNNIGFFRFNGAIFTFIKGNFDTRNATLVCASTTTLIGVSKLRFKTVQLANLITMDNFFQGSASQICNVISTTSGTGFSVQFTDGFQKISNYVSIQDMTLINTTTNRNSLLLTYSKANRGRNVGNITYGNNKPNGIINYTDFNKSSETMVGIQLQGDPAYN